MPSSQTHIAKLDLLRSVAVLSVFLFHLLLYFQRTTIHGYSFHDLGHWGVLIFFVHTSFVLMLSMERHLLGSPQHSLFFSFYVRRIFRIYPLSILIVLVVVFLHLPVGHLKDSVFLPVHFNTAGAASNVFLIQDLTGFESVLAPLWSLPYEINMYLVLPFLFLLSIRWRSPIPLVALFAAATVAGHYSYLLERHGFPDWLVYVPCFLAGVLAFQLLKLPSLHLPSWVWPLGIVFFSIFYLRWPTLAHAWLACLGLGILLTQCADGSNRWINRTCSLIAKYSYGIYLTHFIVLWFVFQWLHPLPRPIQLAIYVIGTALLSMVLYHLLEHPMIRIGQKLSESGADQASSQNPFRHLTQASVRRLSWSRSRNPSAVKIEEVL